MNWAVAAGEVGDKTLNCVRAQTVRLEHPDHVEEIARVLTIQCGDELYVTP